MCEHRGEIKAESVVANVAPAAVGFRNTIRTVREVRYRDGLWEQTGFSSFHESFNLLDLCLDSLAQLSVLGMYTSTENTST